MTGAALALWSAIQQFSTKGGWVMSSHVAMSMMLALFPFVLFVVALAGSLSQDVPVADLIDLVFGSWPEEIAEPIVREVNAVLANSGGRLITIGGALAIFFASNGVDAVRQAMSQAYRDTDPRPYWRTRLLCIFFVVTGGAIVLATAVVGVFIPLYLHIVTDAVPGNLELWLTDETTQSVFGMVLLVLAVTACHMWLPGLRHPIRQIWPGVILTIVLWFIAGQGFSIYIARFASYSATYAGLAGAMSALIFLYMMGAILILGAEFNGALIQRAQGNDPDAA